MADKVENIVIYTRTSISLVDKPIQINIKETDDEWYYTSMRKPFEKYYKCDQLEGLMNFLNYINSIDDVMKFISL
jgi:hypothetical protein